MNKDIRKIYCHHNAEWGHLWVLYEIDSRKDICFKSETINKLTILNKVVYNKLKKQIFNKKSVN